MINVDEIFKQKIIQSLDKKTGMPARIVKYKSEELGITLQTQRRDLTYPMVTFLLALEAMEKRDRKEYHKFRDVMAVAEAVYGCIPSDYPLLNRWWLAENGTKGEFDNKFWRLTPDGRRFLNENFKVKAYHYKVPHTNQLFWSQKKTTFKELENDYFTKNNRETWFNNNDV